MDDRASHDETRIDCVLPRLKTGHCGTVRRVTAADEAIRKLQAMGICEGRRVMLVRRGDPMILRVLGSRIGVSARLAEQVRVEACPADLCEEGE